MVSLFQTLCKIQIIRQSLNRYGSNIYKHNSLIYNYAIKMLFWGFFFANDNANFNNTNAHKFAIAMNVYIFIHKR